MGALRLQWFPSSADESAAEIVLCATAEANHQRQHIDWRCVLSLGLGDCVLQVVCGQKLPNGLIWWFAV